MRLSLLLAATLLLTACAGTDAHRAELREYSELEWRDRFIAYRRRCNSAGGFVLVRARNSVDGDGVPAVGDGYQCLRQSVLAYGY
jgi:hypothetical protein